ncbi:MAG: hypothetical protein K5886_11420 [Lachnospiraceae bacterium]|nr:hypothetical protein [Lachnospiraceae bacterium]
MSMNTGTDYSLYKTGYTNTGLLHSKKADEAEYGKSPGSVSGKVKEWGENNEKTGNIRPDDSDGVIYEKSGEPKDNSTYSINKMSASDRAAIVDRMKEDARQREQQLIDIVKKTVADQAGAYGKAAGNDIWTLLSGGKVRVSEAERIQAQKDISEDGYYGVRQTSQRLFDFACALAGDDVDKMKEMQKAMEKGFRLATKSWGKEKLPGICGDTFDAANKLFEEYYRSKEPGADLSAGDTQ